MTANPEKNGPERTMQLPNTITSCRYLKATLYYVPFPSIFFLLSGRIRVNLLSYDSKSIDIRYQTQEGNKWPGLEFDWLHLYINKHCFFRNIIPPSSIVVESTAIVLIALRSAASFLLWVWVNITVTIRYFSNILNISANHGFVYSS